MTSTTRNLMIVALIASISLNVAVAFGYAQAVSTEPQSETTVTKASRQRNFASLAQELDLTQEQRRLGAQIRKKIQAVVQADRAKLKTDSESFWNQIQEPQPDKKILEGLVERQVESVKELNKSIMAAIIEFAASLTPAQKQKLMEMMKNRKLYMGRFLMSG